MAPLPSKAAILGVLTVVLAGCSGGNPAPLTAPLTTSSSLAARCAAPRVGTDAFTGAAYRDRQGTAADEKAWVHAWMEELYLWYREIPQVDAASYGGPSAYFMALLTPALSPSGKPKDQFSFTFPTAQWEALAESGVEVGYGVQWAVLAPKVPRRVVAAFTQPGSPADAQGIARGVEVLFVDGADVVNATSDADVKTINAGLFPTAAGEPHTLVLRDLTGAMLTATLTAGAITTDPVSDPVLIPQPDGTHVGYVLFNDHVATAEAQLAAAVSALKTAGVSDLVLDLRYNGGGYLDVASELAFMIAGPSATAGKTFELTRFNDKYPGLDPVSGQRIAPVPFESTAPGYLSLPRGQPLPSLDLPRVFVLTGPNTCSASESIVNGLQGIDVEVIQIGSTTCGKPYGFYPQDNCGTTYFAIEFQGVNAKGFGDYADGFTPGGTGGASPPGCAVADDFDHALGDPAEARLATALYYRANGKCPDVAVARRALSAPSTSGTPADGVVPKSPWRTNRILRR